MSEREPEDILNNFLKTNKDDHYNFEEEENYKKVSGRYQILMVKPPKSKWTSLLKQAEVAKVK